MIRYKTVKQHNESWFSGTQFAREIVFSCVTLQLLNTHITILILTIFLLQMTVL